MRLKPLAALKWLFLSVVLWNSLALSSGAQDRTAADNKPDAPPTLPTRRSILRQRSWRLPPSGIPVKGCSVRPLLNPPKPHIETRFVPGRLTRDRFRADATRNPPKLNQWAADIPAAVRTYQPTEWFYLAHPTNFGERYRQDILGNPAVLTPLIVLHETVGSGWSAVRLFLTPHARDADQVSYHTLIMRNGKIIYLVPPDKRAFGAGNSIFRGRNGWETVRTSRTLSPSVNNFAYHISLETPPDGRHNGPRHSGYTNAQYYSLAWLVAKTGLPRHRITTHQAVDRSGSRQDPRSFNWMSFQTILNQFPQTQEIQIGCPGLPQGGALLSGR